MPVNLTGINLIVDESYFNLSLNGEMINVNYRADVVYGTTRQIEEVAFEDSDLVFVGYGVNAPEYEWNDYKVDVKGKTVVMLINDPGFELKGTEFNGKAMTYYGRWTYKFEEAARQGAAGVLIIEEAGGKVSDISEFRDEAIDIRASNSNIYQKMLEKIKNF